MNTSKNTFAKKKEVKVISDPLAVIMEFTSWLADLDRERDLNQEEQLLLDDIRARWWRVKNEN